MFVKIGKREHLEQLAKGNVYFSHCGAFQKIENIGQGDKKDGYQIFPKTNGYALYANGKMPIKDVNVSVICKEVENLPTFCLLQTDNITSVLNNMLDLSSDFKDADSVLIIKDEIKFLENMRYSFQSKIFASAVYYYSEALTLDYLNFIQHGKSECDFKEIKSGKNKVYMNIIVKLLDGSNFSYNIDYTNFYKTAFAKSEFFSKQQEYRFVLPYESIHSPKIYQIQELDDIEIYGIDEFIDKFSI